MNLPFLSKKHSSGTPYCTAPFTSVLVDPSKNVRPCCTFGGSLGNLGQTALADILKSPQWNEVKTQITNGETPVGCVNCYEREKATGWSVRTSLYDPKKAKDDSWTKWLTQLEINSSNICNLACTHCTSEFSSRWVQLNDKFGKEVAYHHIAPAHEIHAPNPENIVQQIAALDLSHLEVVRFKGGEPMLNLDVPAVLRYLLDRGILQNLTVDFISNGSIINDKVLDLLHHARNVNIWISVDGTGELQEYIRRGPSEIARIETFVSAMSALARIRFSLSVSVMVYNVFSLDRISEWWNGFCRKDPGRFEPVRYGLHVIEPGHLAVSVLQDSTRKRLIQKYRRLSGADYGPVLHSLKQPFAGPVLHNEFVTYTRDMDKVWSSDVLKVVPELEPEMVLLAMPTLAATAAPRVRTWRLRLSPDHPSAPVMSQGDTLRKGMSLSESGRYTDTLGIYDAYLEATANESLSVKWEILLHRAIVLGKVNEWDRAHADLCILTRAAPHRTLKALQQSEGVVQDSGKTAPGTVLGAISPALGNETGFVQAPSFRFLMEGLSYRALENHSEAVARLDRALELDPEFALAKVAKRELFAVA